MIPCPAAPGPRPSAGRATPQCRLPRQALRCAAPSSVLWFLRLRLRLLLAGVLGFALCGGALLHALLQYPVCLQRTRLPPAACCRRSPGTKMAYLPTAKLPTSLATSLVASAQASGCLVPRALSGCCHQSYFSACRAQVTSRVAAAQVSVCCCPSDFSGCRRLGWLHCPSRQLLWFLHLLLMLAPCGLFSPILCASLFLNFLCGIFSCCSQL